jgi:hypothetical protein
MNTNKSALTMTLFVACIFFSAAAHAEWQEVEGYLHDSDCGLFAWETNCIPTKLFYEVSDGGKTIQVRLAPTEKKELVECVMTFESGNLSSTQRVLYPFWEWRNLVRYQLKPAQHCGEDKFSAYILDFVYSEDTPRNMNLKEVSLHKRMGGYKNVKSIFKTKH